MVLLRLDVLPTDGTSRLLRNRSRFVFQEKVGRRDGVRRRRRRGPALHLLQRLQSQHQPRSTGEIGRSCARQLLLSHHRSLTGSPRTGSPKLLPTTLSTTRTPRSYHGSPKIGSPKSLPTKPPTTSERTGRLSSPSKKPFSGLRPFLRPPNFL